MGWGHWPAVSQLTSQPPPPQLALIYSKTTHSENGNFKSELKQVAGFGRRPDCSKQQLGTKGWVRPLLSHPRRPAPPDSPHLLMVDLCSKMLPDLVLYVTLLGLNLPCRVTLPCLTCRGEGKRWVGWARSRDGKKPQPGAPAPRQHLDEVGVETRHQHPLHQLLLLTVLVALGRGQGAVRGLPNQESLINVL